MTYTWKDKHEGEYFIKKRPDKYKRWQQGHSNAQGRSMDKKDNSSSNIVKKEQDNRQFRYIGRNMKEQY